MKNKNMQQRQSGWMRLLIVCLLLITSQSALTMPIGAEAEPISMAASDFPNFVADIEKPGIVAQSSGISITQAVTTQSNPSPTLTVNNGDIVTYTLTIVNNSSSAIADVGINNILPSALQEIKSSDAYSRTYFREPYVIIDPSGGSVTLTVITEINWTINTIPNNTSVSLSFSGQVMGVADGTTINNRVYVFYNGGVALPPNNHLITAYAYIPPEPGLKMSPAPTWFSNDLGGTIGMDWGDFNRDGQLDLALASSSGVSVYRNDNGRLTKVTISIPSGRQAYDVCWADINGDMYLELVVVGDPNGLNYIYRFDSVAGRFVEYGSFSSPYRTQMVRVAAADFNGDGWVDILVSANAINAYRPIQLFINNKNGGLNYADWDISSVTSNRATAALSIADYNRDGRPDVAIGGFPNTFSLLTNTTTNSFSKTDVDINLEYLPYDFAWGDYDQDGYLDLAAAFPLQREARIYRNHAGQGFVLAHVIRTDYFMTPLALDWGDFTGDGNLDLAIASSPPKIYHYNHGTDMFEDLKVEILSVGRQQVWSLRGVNVQGRGNLDLAITSREGPSQIFNNYTPQLTAQLTQTNNRPASSVAWGDVDDDGYLDLVFGGRSPVQGQAVVRAYLYFNDEGDFSSTSEHRFQDSGYGPHPVALADMNRNGKLDLAMGVGNTVHVYLNEAMLANQIIYAPDLTILVDSNDAVRSLAWGDVNDDELLDLLVGTRNGKIHLFLNVGGQLEISPVFTVLHGGEIRGLVWGDFDGDYYLDFAVAAYNGRTAVYRNNGDGRSFSSWWWMPDNAPAAVTAIAVADYNNDTYLDLAVGYEGAPVTLWQNQGTYLAGDPIWTSNETYTATALAWGDWNNDGYPELAVGTQGQRDVVYANLGSTPQNPRLSLSWESEDVNLTAKKTTAIAWGDRDNDGDLDLAVSREYAGSNTSYNGYYENTFARSSHIVDVPILRQGPLPNNPPYVVVERPVTAAAYHYSAPPLLGQPHQPVITFTYRVYDPESHPIAKTIFEYSLDGGSTWRIASGVASAPVISNTNFPIGTQGTFVWNANADRAISDNARFRVTVIPRDDSGPVNVAQGSGITPPFRVRGLDNCYWPIKVSILTDPIYPIPESEIRFQAKVLSASGPLTFTWNLGDGTVKTGGIVRHVYSEPGQYTVTLETRGPACPTARPARAFLTLNVREGRIYLPLVMRNYAGNVQMATVVPVQAQDATSFFKSVDTKSVAMLSEATTAACVTQWMPFTEIPFTGTSSISISPFGINSQPAVNGNGNRIAFWSTQQELWNYDGSIEIMLATVLNDKVHLTQITDSRGTILAGFNLGPSLDHAGTRLVFFSDRNFVYFYNSSSGRYELKNPDYNFEVFLAEVDPNPYSYYNYYNVKICQLTETGLRSSNLLPVISGDGRFVTFASDYALTGAEGHKPGKMEIFRAEIGYSPMGNQLPITYTRVTVSPNGVLNSDPVISEEGNFIAFISDYNWNTSTWLAHPQLFLAEFLSGGGISYTQLTTNATELRQPVIATQQVGQQVTVTVAFVDYGNLFVAEVGPGMTAPVVRSIPTSGLQVERPGISADSTRIVYRTMPTVSLQIHDRVIDAVIGTVEGNQAVVSADGTIMAYVTQDWKIFRDNYPLADLQVDVGHTPQGPFQQGQQFTYVVTMTNAGPSVASAATLTVTLPVGIGFSDVITPSQGSCTPTNQRVRCTLGPLPLEPQHSVTQLIPITLAQAAISAAVNEGRNFLASTAQVSNAAVGEVDRYTTNNSEEYLAPAFYSLQINKTGPVTAPVNTPFQYTIIITNTGAAIPTTTWTVTDTLPLGAYCVSAAVPGGTGTCQSNNEVLWTLPNRALGAGQKLTFTCNVTATRTSTNQLYGASATNGLHINGVNAVTTIVAPTLHITKTAPVTVTVGAPIRYVITVTNTGGEATGVTLTDRLPDNSAFVSAQGGVSPSNRVLTWQLGTLDYGELRTRVFTVTANESITNTIYYVTATNGARVDGQEPIYTYIPPRFQIVKTGPQTAAPNQLITYTLTIINTGGNVSNGDWTITDTLPVGATFVRASADSSFDGTKVTWSPRRALAGGGSFSVTFTVRATQTITNWDYGFYARRGSNVYTAKGTTSITTRIVPALAITKDGPATSPPNADVTYHITVTNTGGNMPAATWTITDVIPVNATVVDISTGGISNTTMITWTDSAPLAHNATRVYTFTVRATTTITNSQYGVRAIAGSETYTATGVDPVVTRIDPELRIVKSGPTSAMPEDPITYVITVTNIGGDIPVAHWIITDTIPSGAVVLSASDGAISDTHTITWTIPSAPLNSGQQLVYTFTVSATQTIVNSDYAVRATVGTTSTYTGIGTPPITTVIAPNLQIRKTGPLTATAGVPFTYTLTVTNTGGLATGLVITDRIPIGASWVLGGNYNNATRVVTLTANSLAYNHTISRTFVVTATQTITNADYAVSAVGGWRATGLSRTTVIAPILTINKTAPLTATAGIPFTYTLTVTNTGGLASNVVITDRIPSGAYWIPGSGGTLRPGGVLSWTVPTVAYNVPLSVTFRVTATQTVVNNDYGVRATGVPYMPGAPVTTTVAPALHITKTAVISPAVGYSYITYTFTISNSGSLATGLVITDSLSPTMTWITGGNYISSTRIVTWGLGTLDYQQQETYILVLTATQTITNANYCVSAQNALTVCGAPVTTPIVIKKASPVAEFKAVKRYALLLPKQRWGLN